MPTVSLSFCFRRGSVTSLATTFMDLTNSPCVYGLGGSVLSALRSTSATWHARPSYSFGSAGSTWARTAVSPSRSEEHTSELQSLMRHPYAVFCLKNTNPHTTVCTPATRNTNDDTP